MSAHRIYCYEGQKVAVELYMRDLGVLLTRDVPYPVRSADQVRGLDHIIFIAIDKHESTIPQSIWDAVTADGALVIHVDDQYTRGRVHIRHYPSPSSRVPSVNHNCGSVTTAAPE